ncbi:hypothetical protein LTR36_004084 [Oleoguttula mirabilis]|uniref:Maintenance of telomere capping protein 6 n=1 Tax=Oleoguttula mirabilis TaxID=1507867 RepID=A0AAV9JGM0_9PEZI|nr:hypothetical protein LTR36_004084 [Oleoguttula mirabilis]
MSLYNPDTGAIPDGIPYIALLSQRDLSLQVPVNYVNLPGVSLTPACFAHQRYEDAAAAKCFSNLLATGFRRFEIDLYWDVTRRLWSLCPVELGSTASLSDSTASDPGQSAQTSLASLASGSLAGRAKDHIGTPTSNVIARQTTAESSSSSAEASQTPTPSLNIPSISTTATLSAGTVTTAVATGNAATTSNALSAESSAGTLIEAGPYTCTTGLNFDLFTDILSTYLNNTETDLNATTRYLIMNMHAAAPASDPTASAHTPSTDSLPRDSNLLSSILATNNSAYLYTPTKLQSQRADLNASGSWFSVARASQPDAAYYLVNQDGGHASTQDGWPSESFIELQSAERLLAGYGTVDPQLRAYNYSGDAALIFPQGSLQAPRDVASSADGIQTGCFYQSGVEALSSVNSSWAISNVSDASSPYLPEEASNLTSCGIAPMLNTTLDNVTAAENYQPYQAFAYATIWAWGQGEPRNNSDAADDGEDDDDDFRCAALNATQGRWQAADCTRTHHGACRIAHQPYQWQISGSKGYYMKVSDGCGDNTTFATPRTALENTYLVAAWREYLQDHHDDDDNDDNDELLWLNFNDLDASTCWVIGQNTTCPYLPQRRDVDREVVVPTVAAVIVFVLAALTVFVKCAANRQSSRRKRRRRDDGWDYEGVPS